MRAKEFAARAFAADLERRRAGLKGFAKDFERRRLALGLTKKKLAELAGIDETGLGRVLKGRSEPLTDTITKLEAALVAQEQRALAHLYAMHGKPKRRAAA